LRAETQLQDLLADLLFQLGEEISLASASRDRFTFMYVFGPNDLLDYLSIGGEIDSSSSFSHLYWISLWSSIKK
jgi:hypothetical protein